MPLQSKFFAGNDQNRYDYLNPGPNAVNCGDVVVISGGDPNVAYGGRIGICTQSQGIDPGALGSLCTQGIFQLYKPDAISFKQGDRVFWDDANNKATAGPASATVIFAGMCEFGNGSSSELWVRCDINRIPNTVDQMAQPATTTTTTSTSTTTSTTTTVHA